MTDAEIDAKLAEFGLVLPPAAAPVAAYVPVVIAGGLAHVSGQLPFVGGKLVTGRLGEAGRHARSAFGVPALPLGAAVEVDAIVAVRAA